MRWRTAVLTSAALITVLLAAAPASAATAPVGSYATFTAVAPGSFDATFSANSAFPTAPVVSTDAGVAAASGRTAFLGDSTGFGAQFGSTRLQPYLTIGTIGAGAPSQTTVTFDAATTPGFGFALGDVDADYVTITATGPGGPLTASQLGVGGGVLNYCNNIPKPTGCGAGTSFTDALTWCPDPTAAAVCASYPAATLVGSGSDTSGAYGWFVPTVAVTSFVLDFHRQVFLPSYQLWLVAPAPAATVTGSLTGAPIGTGIALLDGAGVPIRDIEDEPLVMPVAPDGTYGLVTELGSYQLDVILPAGSTLTDPANLTFTATGDLSLGTLAIVDPNAQVAVQPILAATGVEPFPLVLLAGGLGMLGLVLRGRRRAMST